MIEHAREEARQSVQIFVASENQTNACSMYKKMLNVIMHLAILLVMHLYDCISQSTFVSLSLNDLAMCGHSVVQPSNAGAPGWCV
jgi:hypothetical protein